MVVAWTTDESAYGHVEYGLTAAYGSSTAESAISSPEHAQTIAGLAPGTTYHYRVAATDAAGNIAYSESRTVTTVAAPVLADNEPPTILVIAVSGVSTSTAEITLSTDELAIVQIEYGMTENYGITASAGDEFSASHNISLAGLTASTTYHYRAFAEDEVGNRTFSFDNTFTTGAVTVSAPATTSSTNTSATSSAPNSSPQTVSTSTSTSTINQATSTGTTTTVVATTTATTTAAIASTTIPQATTAFEIVAEPLAASISTSTVKITWTTTEPATSQVFYGATSAYGSSTAASADFSLTHNVTLNGLSPETDYIYGVFSKTADGRSAAIDNLEFTTLPALAAPSPLRISNVRANQIGTSTATIVWTANFPTKGDLRYGASTAHDSSAGKHAVLLVDHVHDITGLAANTTYHYQALITDEAGNSAVSEDRAFRTAATAGGAGTSINQEEAGGSIVLLPDPPDTAPPPPVNIGGGKPPAPLPKPKLVKVDALEGQVIFIFDKTSPSEYIRVVRRNWMSPRNARDGKTVYEGAAESFTDVGLVNGHTYHYGIYRVDQFRGVSKPVLLSATPVAGKDQIKLNVTPVSEPKTPRFVFGKNLAIGATGRDVRHAQLLLAQNPEVYPQGLITGYFGTLTEQAITRFQIKHALPATGIADQKTRTKLTSISKTRVIAKKSSFYRDISLGAQGADVVALQTFLFAEGQYPQALFTGYFGPLTQQALARFQSANSISPANGYFGRATREKVEKITTAKKVP